jgi:hypothetical protein
MERLQLGLSDVLAGIRGLGAVHVGVALTNR